MNNVIIVFLLMMSLSRVRSVAPDVLQTIDVTLDELTGGVVIANLAYDVSGSFNDEMYFIYDPENQCYGYLTKRRFYKGNCGSSTLTSPSFPLATESASFYKNHVDDDTSSTWSTIWDKNWNTYTTSSNEIVFDADADWPSTKFARGFFQERWYRGNLELYDSSDDILVDINTEDYDVYTYDWDFHPHYTNVRWAKIDKDSYGGTTPKLREMLFFNTVPNVVERYFYNPGSYEIKALCYHGGRVTFLISDYIVSIKLSGRGILDRYSGRISANFYKESDRPSFIIPINDEYVFILFETAYQSTTYTNIHIRSLDRSNFGWYYSYLSTGVITNVARIDGNDNTWMITTNTGQLKTLRQSGFSTIVESLDVQFGLSISAMHWSYDSTSILTRGYIALDVEIGLLIEMTYVDLTASIVNVIILGDEKIHTIIPDKTNNGIIVIADDGTNTIVYIVPSSPSVRSIPYRKVFDNILVTKGNTFMELYDESTYTLRVGERNCQGSCRVFSLVLEDCSQYSCADCGYVNPVHCGSCGSQLTCTNSNTCSGATFQVGQQCPYIVSATPIPFTGTSSGGTPVTIYSSGTPLPVGSKCTFGGVPVNTTIYDGLIECNSPPGSGSVQVSVTGFSEEFTYDYYECSLLSCTACVSSLYAECGWDASLGVCSSGSASLLSSCPAISYFEPTDILLTVAGTEPISVYSNGLETSGVDYRCRFGSPVNIATPASVIDFGAGVSCLSPNQTELQAHTGVPVPITIESSVVLDVWNVHTQIAAKNNFFVRFCSDISICSVCESLGCNYCDSYECTNDECSTIPAGDLDPSECPAMGELSISSDAIEGGSTLQFEVANLPVVFGKKRYTNPLVCVFEFESETPLLATANVNDPVVECLVPSVPTPGTYQVYVSDTFGSQVTIGQSFDFYDCTTLTCLECASDIYSRCQFCDGSCFLNETCTLNGFPVTGCPDILSIEPAFLPFTGGDIIILTENLPSAGILQCRVNNVDFAPASISNDFVTCSILGSAPGVYDLSISSGGESITSSVAIELYDCSYSTSCSDCLSDTKTECTFCGGKCQFQCPLFVQQGIKQGCAIVQSVWPPLNEIKIGSTFNVVFETILEIGSFRCSFFNGIKRFSTGTKIDQKTLSCPVPLSAVSDDYSFDIEIAYSHSPGEFVLYAHIGTVTLFSCGGLLTCDDSCLNENCGFCVGTGCVGNTSCAGIFYKETCPLISTVSDFTYSIGFSKNISITILDLVGMPENIMCSFSYSTNFQSPATYISDTVISCELPVLESEEEVVLSIMVGESILSQNTINIDVINCQAATICDSSITDLLCTQIPSCGWCIESHTCSLIDQCSGTLLPEDVCPSFDRITPETTNIDEPVYLMGIHFYDFDEIYAVIGSITVPVIYINSTHLLIEELPVDITRDAQLQIFLTLSNGTEYFPYSRSFTINPDPPSPEPDYVLLAVILTIISVLVLILLIALILYIRKKRTENVFANVNITLQRPDFSELAYGKDGKSLEWNNIPHDNFDVFEDMLMGDRSKTIFKAFIYTLESTDLDRGTKYFTYLTEINNNTLEFLLAAMDEEISQCTSSGTIFRGNSIASKIFKTWSRIIGSPFLFDALGKYVQQLEAISESNLGAYGIDLELDANKTNAEGTDLESNSMQLKFVCNKILTSIMNAIDNIPMQFKEVFFNVKYQIELAGFNEENTQYYAVGGLFFLRFVIPSIFAPHVYGLLPNPPGAKTQRSLVLIAKVLQNVANMVLPGNKEEYMKYLTSYIEGSIPKIQNFYDELCIDNRGTLADSPTPTMHLRMNSLCTLYNIFCYNSGKIEEYILANVEFPEPQLRKIKMSMENEIPDKIKEKNKTKK